MGFLVDFLISIAQKTPWERVVFPSPDHTKHLGRLAELTEKSPPAEQNLSGAEKQPENLQASPRQISFTSSKVSTEETVAYQKRELGKQLLLLESHLQQGCRIPPVTGAACDCCSPKHTITIEALALETYGMTGDPVYQEIAQWAKEIEAKTTIPEIESGKHNYGGDAVSAREHRKRILGTETISALISPRKEITLEEAKKLAAEEAAKHVEESWKEE